MVHSMVFVQEQTKRRVLNVSPWFAVGIEGMENAEGDALLEEVAQHIANCPAKYIHEWKLGQRVAWDNWRMLHNAAGCPADQERYMLSTTIDGDYGLGRVEGEASVEGLKYIAV